MENINFFHVSALGRAEGSIGGGVLSLIVAGLIGYWANNNGEVQSLNIPVWIGLGLVVVVFGTWGDLVESLFKRTIGVKDSGKILRDMVECLIVSTLLY